jgi:radical SAM protein with 4Fe4S-binding SPASM domain
LEDLRDILKQLGNLGFKEVIVTGGEPFMRGDLFKVLEEIRARGFRMTLNTNLLSVGPDDIERLVSLGIERVRTSIYGSDKETHEEMTGVPGSFEILLKKIDLAVKAGLNLNVSCVVCKDNLQQIRDVASLLSSKNVSSLNFVRVIPGGRASQIKESLCLSQEEYRAYLKSLMNLREEGRIGTGYLKNVETFEFLVDPEGMPTRNCSACITNIGIRSDMVVTPCLALVEYPIGDLKNQSLETILSSKKVNSFLNLIETDIDDACKKCKHLNFCKCGCRAHAFYSTGKINARDPGCWL